MTGTCGLLGSLSESYLADLGRVIASWSHVEHGFDIFYLRVVAMKGQSVGSTADPEVVRLMGLSFDRKIDQFRARMRELDVPEDYLRKFEKYLDRMMTARDKRDEVAHSVFNASITSDATQIHPDRAIGLFKSWKNRKAYSMKPFTQERLRRIYERNGLLWADQIRISLDQHSRALPKRPA